LLNVVEIDYRWRALRRQANALSFVVPMVNSIRHSARWERQIAGEDIVVVIVVVAVAVVVVVSLTQNLVLGVAIQLQSPKV
jgi:hypothetical protein